jgi:hypothetical protein
MEDIELREEESILVLSNPSGHFDKANKKSLPSDAHG